MVNGQNRACPACDGWINADNQMKYFAMRYFNKIHEEGDEVIVEDAEELVEVCSDMCSEAVLFGDIEAQ